MNHLFFTVNSEENEKNVLNLKIIIVNEKREILKVADLSLNNQEEIKVFNEFVCEYQPKDIITWDSFMKDKLEEFNINELNNMIVLKDIILDYIMLEDYKKLDINLAAQGYDLEKNSEDTCSILADIFWSFKNEEMFNKEVLKGNRVSDFRKDEIELQNKAKNQMFIDFEFDIENRQRAELISIGCIVSNNLVDISDSFYSLVKPVNKNIISEECSEITHISQEELDNAETLDVVINKFSNWINKYENNYVIYNWGNFDKVALSRILRYNGLIQIYNKYFRDMYDIQLEISKSIKVNDEVISKCIGLEKMKEVYGINGIVKHNALSDAEDLMKVVNSYKKKNYNIYIARSMYKEQIRKTYLWNFHVTDKKFNITYGIVCFIKSLKGDIPIDSLKKQYSNISFRLIKDIPMYLLLIFENDNSIEEFKVKIDGDNKENIKSFIKIELEEMLQQDIIII